MTVRLAPLRWWHIRAAVAMDVALFGADAWSAPMFWSELAQGPDRRYVAALEAEAGGDGEALAGFAGLGLAGPEASVHTIDVHPERQRRGIGTMLLRNLLATAEASGARTVLLEVSTDNVAALRLYERHGFRRGRVRRHYYPGSGKDAVEMRRG